MTSDNSPQPISPLRARMIEDMSVRGFKDDTRRDYVRHVRPPRVRHDGERAQAGSFFV